MTQNKSYSPITTVIYVRGDTRTELKDDLRTCLAHAADHAGEPWLAEPSFESNVKNASVAVANSEPGKVTMEEADYHDPVNRLAIIYGTTTNTQLQSLLNGGRNADRRLNIVVTGPDELADRSHGLDRITTLANDWNTVHFAETGLTVTPGTEMTGAVRRAVMTLTDSVHPAHSEDVDATYQWSGGRPPLGFKVADGERLVEADDFEKVATTLQAVWDQRTSKRRAARVLDCSRATITNAIENRPEMYGLVD